MSVSVLVCSRRRWHLGNTGVKVGRRTWEVIMCCPLTVLCPFIWPAVGVSRLLVSSRPQWHLYDARFPIDKKGPVGLCRPLTFLIFVDWQAVVVIQLLCIDAFRMLCDCNKVNTVLFWAPSGLLDCTRKSYIPPCTGKFALSEPTVSKFGKIFIFPLYYLIHFSH